MNSKAIAAIADAILYEGYVLYPYRPSSIKNRVRWNFGVLYPRSYSRQQTGADTSFLQTECLVRGTTATRVRVTVRFLQEIDRRIGKLSFPLQPETLGLAHLTPPAHEIVPYLQAGGRALRPWQEAASCEISCPEVSVSDLLSADLWHVFNVRDSSEWEPVEESDSRVVGIVLRSREALTGCADVRAVRLEDDLFRITATVSNFTGLAQTDCACREKAISKSLLSAHVLLGATNGEFVSLLDPPPDLERSASECKNLGVWPVLVGDDGSKDAMLASPIILYDYPRVAPESPGQLYDGTEIDEILALRILTLTDQEKDEMISADPRAREVLNRTENLSEETWLKLHGILRDVGTEPPLQRVLEPDVRTGTHDE